MAVFSNTSVVISVISYPLVPLLLNLQFDFRSNLTVGMTENKLNWMVKLTAHFSKVNIFSDSCVNVMWGNVLSSWFEQGTSIISFFFICHWSFGADTRWGKSGIMATQFEFELLENCSSIQNSVRWE